MKRLMEGLVALILGALVLVPFTQVIGRSLFNAPFVGAEELTRFLLICLVFAAYPLVISAGENIVMGEFKDMLPAKARRVADLAISILAVAATAFLAYVAWTTIFRNLNNATPSLKIPYWLFFGSTFVAFAGAALVHALHLRRPPQAATNVSL